MEMKLSKRLTAIADLVPAGRVMADIGTDHAHLPICLVQRGIVPEAIAMDVGEGPLSRAGAAIARSGLAHRIQTRLSDGFAALAPGEVGCAVIAGMGGDLMIRILREGEAGGKVPDTLVLSPQSEIPRVRAFLRAAGFLICREDMVLEEGKYYQMMRAERAGQGKREEKAREEAAAADVLIRMQDRYGPLLLKEAHPVLADYLRWERGCKENIYRNLEKSAGAGAALRRQELTEALALNDAALEMMSRTASEHHDRDKKRG